MKFEAGNKQHKPVTHSSASTSNKFANYPPIPEKNPMSLFVICQVKNRFGLNCNLSQFIIGNGLL